MMKKTLLLVAVLVFASAMVANAYVLAGSAKDGNNQNFMTALQFGDSAQSMSSMPSPVGGTVELAMPRNQAWMPGQDMGTWDSKELLKPAQTLNQGWKFALWGNNFAGTTANPGQARLRFWISNVGNNGTLGQDISSLKFTLKNLATGQSLVTGLAVDTTKNAETKPWIDVYVPIVNTAGNPALDAVPYLLTVPEPGSMLAMLSGLVGLVGFGIRRRK